MSTPSELAAQGFRDIWDFLLELYSYRALLASITPLGALETQTITVDPFLNSLGSLSQYESYGVYFGCGRSIFEFIPLVSQLTNQRLVEDGSGNFSVETYAGYKLLESRIRLWSPTDLKGETKLKSPQLLFIRMPY